MISTLSLPSRRNFIAAGCGTVSTLAAANANGSPNASGVRSEDADSSSGDSSVTTPIPDRKHSDQVPLAPPDQQPAELKWPQLGKRRIGFAVVGLGVLSLEEILPAFALCEHAKCTALISGHRDKAEHVAKFYGVPTAAIYNYEDYDRLADNPDVDVIYIVLPNNMHAEYTIRGVKAGKHVLCEKPMAVTIDECQRMNAAADEANRKLMIAYRLHYEPMNRQVMDWCREQKFGPIRTINSTNSQNVEAPNIRLSETLGGGPLGDIGIYSINAMRYITSEEPIRASGRSHSPADDPRFAEVPASVAFMLEFPSGVLAVGTCCFNGPVKRDFHVHCQQGTIDMDPAFAYRGLQLFSRSVRLADSS